MQREWNFLESFAPVNHQHADTPHNCELNRSRVRRLVHSFTHPVEKVQGFAGVQAAAEGDEDSGVGSPNCTSSQARGPEPAHHHGDGVRKGREERKEGGGRRTGNRRRQRNKEKQTQRDTERGAKGQKWKLEKGEKRTHTQGEGQKGGTEEGDWSEEGEW